MSPRSLPIPSRRNLLAGLWLAICLLGCGPRLPALDKLAPLPEEKVCRIAVIPFASEADSPQGATLFYRVFLAELVRLGQFDVVQEGDVREVLRNLRIWPEQQPELEQIKILGERLGSPLLVEGTLLEMEETSKGGASNPSIAVSLQILDSGNGKTLWTTYHRREGSEYRKIMHFGVIHTATSLADRVSQEILERWFQEGLNKCTE